jgi:hypothetical protein
MRTCWNTPVMASRKTKETRQNQQEEQEAKNLKLKPQLMLLPLRTSI